MSAPEDANDLLRQRGRGAVQQSFDAAGLADNTPYPSPRDMLVPTLWIPPDPATIPLRPWLYGRLLMRGTLTVTIAPGGVGKSILAITEAVAMAARRSLLGLTLPAGALRIWYVNCEDPNGAENPELSRRAAAVCLHYGVSAEDLGGRLFLDSAVLTPVQLAGLAETNAGFVINETELSRLEREIRNHRIDAIILDPFVSVHSLNENDNAMIDRLAKRLVRLADQTGSAVHIIHHTRKSNGTEIDVDSARGASALIAAARIVRVLNPMTKSEAEKACIRPEDRRRFFRTSLDKQNLAPPESDHNWHELISVDLGNGTPPLHLDSESVGVPQRWRWPDTAIRIDAATIRKIQEEVDGQDFPANAQAVNWVGWAIARVIGVELTRQGKKAPLGYRPVADLQARLIDEGRLAEVGVFNKKSGRDQTVVRIGEWIEFSEDV
jgi:hypothetical protein